MTTAEEISKVYEANRELQAQIDHRDATIKQLQEENEILRNDLDDALDVKNGNGPTALSRVVSENKRLKDALRQLVETGDNVPSKAENARNLIEP